MSKKLVISAVACVAVVSTFLSTSEAKRTRLVRPDIPGQVADVLSQGLAMGGLEVYRNGYSLTIVTKEGQVVDVQLPSTLDALKRGEFTASRNGTSAPPPSGRARATSRGRTPDDGLRWANPIAIPSHGTIDIAECLELSFNIYQASLEICSRLDGEIDVYCVIEASANLPLNALKCTFAD